MTDLDAKVSGKYEIAAVARSADGYTADFKLDDSLASWWSIVRWNLHHHHSRVLLRNNLPDLFTKVLRRKLWRR